MTRHRICRLAVAVIALAGVGMTGCARGIRLHAEPAQAMLYDPVCVRVTGCPDGQCVTIRASMRDEGDIRWESVNHFMPRGGVVDLEKHAPESGTYTGIDAMGFVWSMQPQTDEPSLLRHETLAPIHLKLEVQIEDGPVTQRQLVRWIRRPGVRRTEVREDGLVGALFTPEGAHDLPGILAIGGSGGGLREGGAALLASAGYPTLALAYFRAEGLPDTLTKIPLEYFERAIQHLQGLPEVDAERIGVMGGSRGGELALLLGATYPEIKCVVAFVPSGLIWGGFPTEGAAWTLDGEPLPYVDYSQTDPKIDAEFMRQMQDGEPAAWTPAAASAVADREAQRHAEIAVEKTRGPVLLISGTDDAMWPSELLANVAMERFRQHSFPYSFEHASYPGAGHAIGAPYLPTTVSQVRHPVVPQLMELGGTPEGTARACEDSWRKTLAFLKKSLEHADR